MTVGKKVHLKVQLDNLAGSVNAMLIPSKNGPRLIYGGKFRQNKKKVLQELEANYGHLRGAFKDHPEKYCTKVIYEVSDNWITLKGTLRKKDVSNFTKNFEDVIFEFLGCDDCSIVEVITRKKVISKNEYSFIECDIVLFPLDVWHKEKLYNIG